MTTPSAWRTRWAARQNAKIQARYRAQLAPWEYKAQVLRYHHELARTTQPIEPPPGIKLERGERLFCTVQSVSMVELPDTVSLFTPVHETYSARVALPYTPTRDHGIVAVTDQRVIFLGTKGNREWGFAQLVGIGYGATTPLVLMRVSNRQRLSGLVFTGDTARDFRLFIGLALAEHAHDRAGFIAHLGHASAHHEATRPPVPAPAEPAAARHPLVRFFFGDRGASPVRKIAPSLATGLALLCLCGALLPAPPPEPEKENPRAQAPAAGVAEVTTPPAIATTAPTVAPTTEAQPTTQTPPPPATTRAPAPKTTTPKPKPVDLCGAPANPWNYTFCGGSYIDNPPSNFCSYFNCINSFWDNTNGYVMQCEDLMFSHSGGVRGSCSYHGGNKRPLYRP